MSLTVAVNAPSRNLRFAGFLAAAAVLHALLLLLPADRDLRPREVLHRLSVSLRAVTEKPPLTTPAPAQPESEPAPAVDEVRTAAEAPATRPLPAMPATPPGPADEAPAPALSTARLLDHANRMRWAPPDAGEPRRLGVPARVPGPERGQQRGIPGDVGGAGAATAAGLEIVDRWLAADGSHNVLIRTPGGRVLCGRAEAWDPMQPLVEHVMMLRDCGDGEPTFEWPDAYRSSAPKSP